MKEKNGDIAFPTENLLKKLGEKLSFSPVSGQISLFDQRMLLMHGFSLSELRKELVQRLGLTQARGVLTRLGYQQGASDHANVEHAFGLDEDYGVAYGPVLRDMEGYVLSESETLHMDQEKGEFYGDFTWVNSWEADAHLAQFGVSGIPACWMNVGYATAYATSLFGHPILAREVECVAMGHSRCRAIMRPLEEWGDVASDLEFFQVENFVNLPSDDLSRSSPTSSVIPFETVSPEPEQLVGVSPGFNAVIYMIKQVASAEATVLFQGESGVGKELFSRKLHGISGRASKPFISINCAAIPENLIEAELFGVEKGAYTGATCARPGRFERASGGTLFLDEIGSLPLPAQGKLLRVLQEREVERVGGTRIQKIDVRVIAATNENLREAVKAGTFRADLFYRLNVFPIRIPPLKERKDDIPLLLGLFVERYSRRLSKPVKGITRHAREALFAHDWPGNVRELENMVERAIILAEHDGAIDTHHLFSGDEELDWEALTTSCKIGKTGDVPDENAGTLMALAASLVNSGYSLQDIEAATIEAAMIKAGGKVSDAANALKIGRGKMQYRLSRIESGKKSTDQ